MINSPADSGHASPCDVVAMIACRNRVDLTLRILTQLHQQAAALEGVRLSVVVFDDGSSDGTASAIRTQFPDVDLLSGDGTFYWAASMAAAESRAFEVAESPHTRLLWLNDDDDLDGDALSRILDLSVTHEQAVVVGAMRDPVTKCTTYSGLRRAGVHPLAYSLVEPSDHAMRVEAMNGNLVCVPLEVAKAVGGIDGRYAHAWADIDYAIRCRRFGFDVLLAPHTFGACPRNPAKKKGNLFRDLREFSGPKGGGNIPSLRRLLQVSGVKRWYLYVTVTHLMWGLRRLRGSYAAKRTMRRGRISNSAELPVRVLHILATLRPSGMERMLLSGAKYFQAEGVEGFILGRRDSTDFAEELARAGYSIALSDPPTSSALGAARFVRYVRRHRIDVVHIHTEGDYLRTAILARLAVGRRGAVVRTVHSTFLAHGSWLRRRRLQARLADPQVDALTAPSPDACANELASLGRRCTLVFNWIDDSFWTLARRRRTERSNIEPDSVVMVGNCSSIKNHELGLRVALAAGLKVFHIGDESGASAEELELLESLSERGLLAARGAQPPDTALLKGGIFLATSTHEGMSLSLAEALTVGIPALVSDVAGHGWAEAAPGVTMVPLGDDSAWVECLHDLPPAGRSSSGDLPDFSAARGVRAYARIYRGALWARRRRGQP